MRRLLKWIVEIAGFLFAGLIPVSAILFGGLLFVTLIPEYAFFLTIAWEIIVIVLYIRYSKWY